MKNVLLIVSAAAMAVSMPALAQQGNGKGKGNGGDKAAKFESRGNGNAGQARGNGRGKPDKAVQRAVKAEEKRIRRDREVRRDFADDRRERDRERMVRGRFDRDDRNDRDWDDRDRRDWAQVRGDCPPGLAKKNNGCMPPGQAKKVYRTGERFDSDWNRAYNLPMGYRSVYSDTPNHYYRYDDDGYIYRVNRQSNLVSALIPLLGGGFAVGQPMPTGYGVYNLPVQYRDVYYDSPDAYYRYGDNAIYRVDPQTRMIESVVALLTGDNLALGSTLPAGYGAYNVPMAYRDRYYDTDESLYRYANGNIYQVDPQTRIIQAIISALI